MKPFLQSCTTGRIQTMPKGPYFIYVGNSRCGVCARDSVSFVLGRYDVDSLLFYSEGTNSHMARNISSSALSREVFPKKRHWYLKPASKKVKVLTPD